MSLKIRLSRGGAKKRPFYRVVVADARSPRDGRFIERLGTFDPLAPKDSEIRLVLDVEKAKEWLGKGAQPTDRVARLLDGVGALKREPRNNPEKAPAEEEGAGAHRRGRRRRRKGRRRFGMIARTRKFEGSVGRVAANDEKMKASPLLSRRRFSLWGRDDGRNGSGRLIWRAPRRSRRNPAQILHAGSARHRRSWRRQRFRWPRL